MCTAMMACPTMKNIALFWLSQLMTSEGFMLTFHQAILALKLTHNLISPMQVCDAGIHINDEPKHIVPTPTDDHNAIVVTGDNNKLLLHIPLRIHATTHYFSTRKPNTQE